MVVRWYLSYSLSYRNIEEMMLERGIKRITKPMMGFKAFHSADATLSEIELCRMLKKGQHIDAENLHAFEQFYRVDLNPTKGSEINKLRPCVLVGATPINQARHTVVVVPLSTSAVARPPITIAVSCLEKIVTAVCDQIRTVDKNRLKKRAGKLSDKDMSALDDGLRQVLVL